jgi:pimeloyl-ACP methyl ester carboxylesterase
MREHRAADTLSRMTIAAAGTHVSANGIDIHYVEAGAGEPLVLLHHGMASTDQVWADSPTAYVRHMAAFAERFRVIAPDLRGCGRTANPGGGPISYAQLADDAAAMIDALGLDRPLVCGFSDGATLATILAIRSPGSVRAIVNHAGYDLLNPEAPSMAMARQMLGGRPDATEADPAAAARFFESSEQTLPLLAGMRAEHGEGWTRILTQTYARITTSPGYTFEDLRSIGSPTLILAGDRDVFCSVEEGAEAYRMLRDGELAILPGEGHVISPAAVEVCLGFLGRHALR